MKKPDLKRYLLIVWILFIFINSLLPAQTSSLQSGFVTSMVKTILDYMHISYDDVFLSSFIRTFAHFIEFFILGVFIVINHASLNTWYKKLILILVIPIIDETIQLFTPGRAFEWFDIAIDLLGGFMGIIASLFLMKLIKHLEHLKHS